MRILIIGSTLLLSAAGAGAVEFPAMDHLSGAETWQRARLSAAEVKQIVEQVEFTAYDTPDSWRDELRVRRVSLGSVDGLVLQGSRLLCGGTGNCQTWVFGRDGSRWVCLFADQAPIAAGFGFDSQQSQGLRNLVLTASTSADTSTVTVFVYDGRAYAASRCYRISEGRAARRIEEVRCQ